MAKINLKPPSWLKRELCKAIIAIISGLILVWISFKLVDNRIAIISSELNKKGTRENDLKKAEDDIINQVLVDSHAYALSVDDLIKFLKVYENEIAEISINNTLRNVRNIDNLDPKQQNLLEQYKDKTRKIDKNLEMLDISMRQMNESMDSLFRLSVFNYRSLIREKSAQIRAKNIIDAEENRSYTQQRIIQENILYLKRDRLLEIK